MKRLLILRSSFVGFAVVDNSAANAFRENPMNNQFNKFFGAIVFGMLMSLGASAQVQTSPGEQPAVSEAAPLADRGELLNNRRWRRLERDFDEWMSVQVIYTPEEIAALKARLQDHIKDMSAEELEDFMDDAEVRMDLLLSDDVLEARSWLSFMNPQARRDKVGSNGEIPDVFGMSVSQLRMELNQFQQQRAQQSAAHATFNQSRQLQTAPTRQTQQPTPTSAPREAATFGNQPNFPTPPPPRKKEILPENPRFWVTPWGIAHPIY
jgi:hypothetical protein